MKESAIRVLLATALISGLSVVVVSCTYSTGVRTRSSAVYVYHGRSPFYRCCRYGPGYRPPIIPPPDRGGPEPELPIEPTPPLVALPQGGFDGDFGGDFGGGDFGGGFDGGDFGGDF